MQTSELPFVTVIVPCRDERSWVGTCLDSILASDYPPARMEVLVADGISHDGTRGIVQSYAARDPRVRLIDNPEQITPVALNRAVGAARGDIIMCMGAHAEVAPAYLRRAVGYLETTGADNVGGTMRTIARDSGPFADPIRIVLTHPLGVGNSRFRTGLDKPCWVDTVFGGCWRRQVFDRVGKFNEKLVRSQDMEFNIRLRRAGGKILLAPDLEARYYARATMGAFWRHNWSNGVWAILPFAYSDVVPVRWRHVAPLAFVSAFIVSMVGWSVGWLPWGAPVVVAGPYAAAILGASAAVAVRARRASWALLLPATFASLHFGYGAGSLWGVLRLLGIQARKSLKSLFHETL